jgi:2-polyprenyl-3-methyl-5-hydroxy-6-metoxy-1,4-benzoquinol methylase
MASLSLSRFFRKNKLPAPTAATKAHKVAQEHWRQCTNTFVTNTEYYSKCENAICNELIPRLGRIGRVLDAGCGNGRFTLLLAQMADDIEAHDLSPALIAEAQQAASDAGLTRVRFYVEDVIHARIPAGAYDAVSCMGVLSTIVDDWAFQAVTRKLSAALKTKGLLLLRESVSLLPEGRLVESDTYSTRYRNEQEYCAHFSTLGFTLEQTIPLAEFGTSVNRFYLYRKD